MIKVTFYMYFTDRHACECYNYYIKTTMDYIRARNGQDQTEFSWNLGEYGKYASVTVECYNDFFAEELVWENVSELVNELNTFFTNKPMVFSQFEGYRYLDGEEKDPAKCSEVHCKATSDDIRKAYEKDKIPAERLKAINEKCEKDGIPTYDRPYGVACYGCPWCKASKKPENLCVTLCVTDDGSHTNGTDENDHCHKCDSCFS